MSVDRSSFGKCILQKMLTSSYGDFQMYIGVNLGETIFSPIMYFSLNCAFPIDSLWQRWHGLFYARGLTVRVVWQFYARHFGVARCLHYFLVFMRFHVYDVAMQRTNGFLFLLSMFTKWFMLHALQCKGRGLLDKHLIMFSYQWWHL